MNKPIFNKSRDFNRNDIDPLSLEGCDLRYAWIRFYCSCRSGSPLDSSGSNAKDADDMLEEYISRFYE